MGNYKVGFRDLRFLVEGFVDGMYFTREGAVSWCKENKERITPKFMEKVRANPDSYFYYYSHIEEPRSEMEDFLMHISPENILVV